MVYYMMVAFQVCVGMLYGAYAPEVHVSDEKMVEVRKAINAMKSVSKVVRQAYMAERLGLCFLPNGGYAYQHHAMEKDGVRFYYAYTASEFVGSDGKMYQLRATQAKAAGKSKQADAVKRVMSVVDSGSPEAVWAGFADEITQMCLKTAKNRLDVLPQDVRDCFIAQMAELLYMPDGKDAYTGRVKSTRANGTDIDMEYKEAHNGAKFVDSNGVVQDYYDMVGNRRSSREIYPRAWDLASLCGSLIGMEEVLRLYPDELKAMRKYRKDVETHGEPQITKKHQNETAQVKKPEAVRSVSALRAMPKLMREAYLAERMGLCFMASGAAAYEDRWVILTREGMRVRCYPAKSGARFVDSKGKENTLQTCQEKKAANPTGVERLKRVAADVVRGLYGSDEEAVLDSFSKDIEDLAVKTAKNRLFAMPKMMRAAFLAEEAELAYLPGGKSAYTDATINWRIDGCDRHGTSKKLHPDARFRDVYGKEYVFDSIMKKEWAKHEKTWLLCKWCSLIAGKDAILELFADEVAAMRKQYKEVVGK